MPDNCLAWDMHAATHSRCPESIVNVEENDLRNMLLAFIALFAMLNTPNAHSQTTSGLVEIPAGVPIVDEAADRWNRLILLAKPQIASGDVDQMALSIRRAIAKFPLVILATVQEDPENVSRRFRLREIGVSYIAAQNDRWVTVNSAKASQLGIQLDLISSQILSQNESQLSNLRGIVATESLAIFDTPSILLSQGKHIDYTMRHFIWVDKNTGKMGMVVWLLSEDPKTKQRVVADEILRYVAAKTQEDRRVHVDGQAFFLGIPKRNAFALESMPPGKDFAWSAEAKALAANPSYDTTTIERFANLLSAILSPR